MKKFLFCLPVIFLFLPVSFCQSIVRKTTIFERDPSNTNSSMYSKHELTKLTLFRSDEYTFAVYNQLGVIGNSFDNEGKIGNAPADPDANINSHFPITGYKQTICGILNSYYIRDFCSGNSDDDVHFEIRPAFNSRALIENVNQKILVENSAKLNAQRLPTVDISKDNLIENYNIIVNEINVSIAQINAATNNHHPYMRTLKTHVLSEIDVHEDNKSYIRKFSENVPKQELDCTCSYGPWIHDVGTGGINPFAGFHDYLEIHPAEQVWWVNELNKTLTYHCYLFNDNSGRFDEDSDFDTDGGNLSYYGPWTPKKLDGTFAIAFSYKLGSPKMLFQINKITSKNPLPQNDGLNHFLVYNHDTIAVVKEPNDFDIIDIKFEKIGLDAAELAKPRPDSVIKGFLVIRNSVGGALSEDPINNEREGNILLEITAENTIIRATTNPPQKIVKVRLDKIECLSMKEDEAYGEIFGYSGVRVSSHTARLNNTALFPSDESILLWNRLDAEGLKIKKGDNLYNMGAKEFIVDKDAVVEVRSDLNEDDSNTSNNETMTDDGDDQLSEDGKIKSSKYPVSTLNDKIPVHFTQRFYNSGKRTEIVLHFTITTKNLHTKTKNPGK